MKKITEQQHIEIIEKYQTGKYSTCQLGKEYGVSYVAIIKHLRKEGIQGRTTWAQKENRRCYVCKRVLPL